MDANSFRVIRVFRGSRLLESKIQNLKSKIDRALFPISGRFALAGVYSSLLS